MKSTRGVLVYLLLHSFIFRAALHSFPRLFTRFVAHWKNVHAPKSYIHRMRQLHAFPTLERSLSLLYGYTHGLAALHKYEKEKRARWCVCVCSVCCVCMGAYISMRANEDLWNRVTLRASLCENVSGTLYAFHAHFCFLLFHLHFSCTF